MFTLRWIPAALLLASLTAACEQLRAAPDLAPVAPCSEAGNSCTDALPTAVVDLARRERACSADLQAIVDRDGNLIKRCPADQGCAAGECVPACAAAAQSSGSIGCDFYAPNSPIWRNGEGTTLDGSCYAVFVANTWSRPARLQVTRAGQTFDMTQFTYLPHGSFPSLSYDPLPPTGVPANQVAVLFLSHKPGAKLGDPLTCPAPPALLDDASISGSGKGAAFHIVSDTPITTYDILPFGGAKSYVPSASLLFPTNAWGTNYYAVAPRPDGGGLLWLLLVGAQDGTRVTLTPSQTLPGNGGLAPAPAGTATSFAINAGQMLQWIGADPTGTIIQSTAPIAVFTGSTFLLVSSATTPIGGGRDSAHQQLPQIKALGSEYVGAGLAPRQANGQPESVPYRVLGVVDGTVLSYEPARPSGAPTMLRAGQAAEFESKDLFVIKSQDAGHPFGFTQYMPGAVLSTPTSCGPSRTSCWLGDEDWVNVLAPRQFLQRYVFFTDPTFATTSLVLTRAVSPSGFYDVTIDCLGAPVTGWQNVGDGSKYQVAYVDLVRGAAPVAGCTGGQKEARSLGPFGVTVWGTDWYSSYGYPAGGNFGIINNVVVIP